MATDRIVFVRYLTDRDAPLVGECVDIRINGESIIPLDEDGGDDLAGLPLRALRENVGQIGVDGVWRRHLVLRCTCGDFGCDSAVVELSGTRTEIGWRDSDGKTRQGTGATFRFLRHDWLAALAHPLRGERLHGTP